MAIYPGGEVLYVSKEARARRTMADYLELGQRVFVSTLDEIEYRYTPEGHADYIRDLFIYAEITRDRRLGRGKD